MVKPWGIYVQMHLQIVGLLEQQPFQQLGLGPSFG